MKIRQIFTKKIYNEINANIYTLNISISKMIIFIYMFVIILISGSFAGVCAGIGTAIEYTFWRQNGLTIGSIIGTFIGLVYFTFETICIGNILNEPKKADINLDKAKIWRKGIIFNVYGGGDYYVVSKMPVSNILVWITYILTK